MSGKRSREHVRSHVDAAPGKGTAELLQGAARAFFDRVLAHAKDPRGFLEGFFRKITEGQDFTIGCGQACQCIVQHGNDGFPDRVRWIGLGLELVLGLHGKGLLLVAVPALVVPQVMENRKADSAEKPAREDGLFGDFGCLLRERNKDGLGDFLRGVMIAGLAQGGLIDQTGVAAGQFPESLFRIPRGVSIQQLPVIFHRRECLQ